MKSVGGEMARVLAPHEPAMAEMYPCRVSKTGHYIVEIALSHGQQSYVRLMYASTGQSFVSAGV